MLTGSGWVRWIGFRPSRTFYDRKRNERLIHVQALLALARRLVDVLWALLRDGRTFTPPPHNRPPPQLDMVIQIPSRTKPSPVAVGLAAQGDGSVSYGQVQSTPPAPAASRTGRAGQSRPSPAWSGADSWMLTECSTASRKIR
jgi:hypothetical protein